MTVTRSLTPAQWEQYDRDGFLLLGRVSEDGELAALNARVDDLMQGRVQYGPGLLMQLDPSAGASGASEYGAYAQVNVEVAGQTVGFKGPSMAYRKIGEAQAGLEVDPLFAAFQSGPLFQDITARVYGAGTPIAIYRSMVMAKPSGDLGGGTPLPWHQDGGDWWALSEDPLCFVWTALSDATIANGAVQVVRGSHKLGLLSKRGHTLTPEGLAAVVEPAEAHGDVVDVELKAGEAFLCHNFTVHRSGINTTAGARRGFSANYVRASTRVLIPKPELAGPLGEPGTAFPDVVFAATA
jgi:hypothetical protein